MLALAERACAAIDGAFFCGQFANPANERSHYAATGAAARAAPPPEIIVVEPELSRVLSGGQHHNGHGVTGIGAGVPLAFAAAGEAAPSKFAPDAYEAAALGDALDAARDLGLTAGVLAGPSSGAALCVAAASRGGSAKSRVVVVLPSAGERYLTHPLFDAARLRPSRSSSARRAGRSDAALSSRSSCAKRRPRGARRRRRPSSTRAPRSRPTSRPSSRARPTPCPDARLEDLGATSLTAARLLGKLAQSGALAEGSLPGAKVALLKVALLGTARDLARVLLRLGPGDAPLPGAPAPPSYAVHVELFGAQFAALSAFLASLFEGLPVAGGEDAGMTGAFRVTLATPNGSVLLSPYGFIDTPAARARGGFMNVLYHGFNFITGYDHADPSPSSVAWRLIILESFAGVPGSVAAGFRHFYSLRELKRDHGAIFTFLEEAENERMHLLVCMKMFEASPATRALVVAAQFTMTPLLCATYAASPRAMHRFVGYLEETAVMTYANLVEKAATPGTRLHGAWAGLDAPDIAKSYWKLDDDASWAECLRHMLADESHHRDVNHAFAELPRDAENPFIGDHMRDFDKAATAHAAAKRRE
ncbi:hypothetical protein JL721_10951 [Aureococcus anophagefferens]|nr:hypothetical protein JL721_10951 [Aureococcus anophagefferens]